MSKHRRSITLVLGGARSGKSRFAQELAAGSVRVAYLATARASDSEMKRKIRRHRVERPSSWETIEVESDLAKTIRYAGRKTDLLLVECMTTYVGAMIGIKDTGRDAVEKEIEKVCDAIRETSASVIVVSNEAGSGVVPPFPSGRLFQDVLGHANQQIAAIADTVILMVAGIPVGIKGRVSFSRK
jgi:adenosylcobinamide kinase/adenosylcobinamide-phosphate guanylyltransferase